MSFFVVVFQKKKGEIAIFYCGYYFLLVL